MSILLKGTITFNGQDIAYTVEEVEKEQINISVSFVRGSNTNSNNLENKKEAVIVFDKVEENTWKLNREKTESEVDVKIDYEEISQKIKEEEERKRKWLLSIQNFGGLKDLKIIYEKSNKENVKTEEKSIYVKANDKNFRQDDKSYVAICNENINLNLDGLINYLGKNCGALGKFVVKPVAKGLCEDFERTVKESILKANNILTNTKKGITRNIKC